jgi:hypothetical protein
MPDQWLAHRPHQRTQPADIIDLDALVLHRNETFIVKAGKCAADGFEFNAAGGVQD